jgi:hypothetical protein
MDSYDIKRLALILAIQAEIEGMKAFNTQREMEGNSIGYNQTSFDEMANQLRDIAYKPNDLL